MMQDDLCTNRAPFIINDGQWLTPLHIQGSRAYRQKDMLAEAQEPGTKV